jgi:two-component system, chemotaxis family, chemotaxis protein CheY
MHSGGCPIFISRARSPEKPDQEKLGGVQNVPRTVLVVDDSKTMREMVSFTLKTAGFEVLEGGNGEEGLAQADKRLMELVISDVNMPVMDGITFVQQLRTRAKYKFTPVLMLTTESQDAKKQAGKAAGATGWLVKPFNPEQLIKVIAKVLP